MQQTKITFQTTSTHEVELPIPSYFQVHDRFFKVIDERNCVTVLDFPTGGLVGLCSTHLEPSINPANTCEPVKFYEALARTMARIEAASGIKKLTLNETSY